MRWFVIGALAGCSAGKDEDGTIDTGPGTGSEDTGEIPFDGTTLAEVQAQVFTPSCGRAYCHDAAAVGRPRLVEGLAYGDLVNVPATGVPGAIRVVPGEPTNSYLIMKLNGIPGIYGAQMPFGENLEPTLITLVEKWISDGALDN